MVSACDLVPPGGVSVHSPPTSARLSQPPGGTAQITFEGVETGSARSISVTTCLTSDSRFLVVMDGQVSTKRFRVGLIVPGFHGDGLYVPKPVGFGVGSQGQGTPSPLAGQEVSTGEFGNLDIQDNARAVSIDEVERTRVQVQQHGRSGSFHVAYAPVVGDIPDYSQRATLAGNWSCG